PSHRLSSPSSRLCRPFIASCSSIQACQYQATTACIHSLVLPRARLFVLSCFAQACDSNQVTSVSPSANAHYHSEKN
ncbi:hypothetical protein B0H11DRAFT_2285370, partial [Mycena galericulata]